MQETKANIIHINQILLPHHHALKFPTDLDLLIALVDSQVPAIIHKVVLAIVSDYGALCVDIVTCWTRKLLVCESGEI